jgi:hypothetical protein
MRASRQLSTRSRHFGLNKLATHRIEKTGDCPVSSNECFVVCIDEIRQNFVFGDLFSGSYTKSVTMSDGSIREITLRPIMKDGQLVVEIRDGDHRSYMGPNGTTTHGTLMIGLRQVSDHRQDTGLVD